MKWLGHACFYMESPAGVRILMDPYDAYMGYTREPLECDVVTVSHEHGDHNDLGGVLGAPTVLHGVNKETGEFVPVRETVGDVSFRTVSSMHDPDGGAKRGKNAIFVFDIAGLKVVHLGDLGHELSKQTVSEIGPCDVLLIPVGGYYTIDGRTAAKVRESLSPRVAVPMHYKTTYNPSSPISGPSEFLALSDRVRDVGQEMEIELSTLPDMPETWVFSI